MPGRRELVAAAVAALLGATAVMVLARLDDVAGVVEVRVQGRTIALPEPDAPASGRVVWAERGDVWLYDAETDRRRPLTTDGVKHQDSKPRFRDRTHVTYVSSNVGLMEYDLSSGRSHVLQRLPGRVRAYDWSPDGATLAYYGPYSDDGPTELHIVGSGPARLRPFVPILGRGGYVNHDETRIEWAPDGRHLLLEDTALDTSPDQTLYILNADGSDAAAPRLGTWSRWSADGSTVYCLCSTAAAQADWRWQAIDTANGVGTPILPAAGPRPSLSPDGRSLAFDDGADTPTVYVADTKKPDSKPRFLARGAIAPIWLGPTHLAFTNTRPCPRNPDACLAGGHGSMFEPDGTASMIDLTTDRRSALASIPTEGADTD